MEGCLTDFRKTIMDKLFDKAIEKSRYFFCFTCIVKKFDDEKVNLKAASETMKQRFDVATRRDKDVQSNAQHWQKQVDKLLQEDTQKKQSCFFGFCPDCIWRYKKGEELANKIEEIKDLMGEKFENIELDRCLPGAERYSSQNYISFESRELKYKELLDALKDDSNYIVGLHGMGGAGKTTMAKEVGKQLKKLEHFKYVIDTTVSFNPDIKKIQDDIAGPLGLEKWGEVNESDRPKRLWSRLTRGDKILVILDDIWENLNFDHIGIPTSHIGCKVLVTTRDLQVCNQMDCGKTIQLDLLTEDDAWVMFKKHANLSNNFSKSFLGKGRKISIECKGLPVAIATIASSLKGLKTSQEWDVALKNLQEPIPMDNVDAALVDIYKCLRFSYDYLKDKNAKELFLLCSLFQEDEEIPVEILTRLGIGVGLFGGDYKCYDDARIQAAVAKNKLLRSCLLLETEKGHVKMHDLVREVAQRIANEEIQVVDLSKKTQKSLVEKIKNVKYLLFQGKLRDLFSSRFDGSKLEILIVRAHMSDFEDVPTSFFENMVELRVLNLSNLSSIDLHLPSLSFPKSIRSLLVEEVILGDISVLGTMQSLETLEFNGCEIDEFSREIAELKKLRLLSLKNCEIISNSPFEVIQRCPSLEELYFWHSFNAFCQEITLHTLQRYHFTDQSCRFNDSISKYVSLRHNYFSEVTYKYLIQTSEHLLLQGIKGYKNLMPEVVPIDQGMNHLIELHLDRISHLQCLVDIKHINSQVPPIVFSELVVLWLKDMENLEELCNGPISFDSLNNLKELCIILCGNLRSLFKCSLNLCNLRSVKLWSCSRLVSVFELSTSQSLPLLEELEICACENLENIITFERRVMDDNKSCYSLFPKLKFLKIEECPQLQFILPILSARDLLFLEVIVIISCHKLKYIFGQHQYVKLTSLKKMMMYDLPNFFNIFPPSASSISKDGSKPQIQPDPIKGNIFSMCCYRYKLSKNIPSVSEDQQQDCSISLESNGNEESGQQINLSLEDIYLHILPMMTCLFIGVKNSFVLKNLTRMEIVGYEKLETVFPTVSRCLPQLVTLIIKECKELKHIIEDDLEDKKFQSSNTCFPMLKSLVVENCHKLKYIFNVSICKEFPELKVMMIREANELEEIFKSELGDKKDEVEEISKSEVEIPNLKVVAFVNLPSLSHAQGVHFEAVKCRLVLSCQKLSLTSTPSNTIKDHLSGLCLDGGVYHDINNLFEQLQEKLEGHNIGDENSSAEHHLTSPQLEGSRSEITAATTLSTITETKNTPPTQVVVPKQKGIQINVEEETTSANAKTITSSTHLDAVRSSSGQLVTSECKTSSQEDGDSHIASTSFSISTTKTNDEGSLNDDSFKKVSSNIKEQFPKDDYISVSKSKPSSSKEDPSQKVEDLSSSLLVKSELEQLVSKNHLDSGNLSLLTDFFVKHPSVRLKDTSLSNRYKGCAYNFLADLLKFLQTHSVLEVLGSCHSEFVELLQDAHSFGFDKDWLDGIERRTLCPDIQVSQDALKKLLDSKEHVTKEVELLCLKISNLSEHMEVLKHKLASSQAVLESIIQQEVVLSGPIGY